MQARLERLRWEQLCAELRAIETERENLRLEGERSSATLLTAKAVSGDALATLDGFRKFVDRERQRLRQKYAECEKRVAAQSSIVASKERDVKVLEHLRERKLATWTAQWDRETEQVAAEAYLSRWHLRSPSE